MRHGLDSGGSDRWLFWKVTAFFFAAGLWLAGVVAEQEWLRWAAGAVLLLAVIGRLLTGSRDIE